MNKELIIKKLTNKDDKVAYEYAKKLVVESAKSNKYLDMISDFADLLKDDNSFVRTRGFILICGQARWDKDNQIEKVFSKMKPLFHDSKPTVIRQCLKAIQEVIVYKPEMSNKIKKEITKIDLSKYKDSVSPLIKKDIDELIRMID